MVFESVWEGGKTHWGRPTFFYSTPSSTKIKKKKKEKKKVDKN